MTAAQPQITADEIAHCERMLRWRRGGPALFAQEMLGAIPEQWQWDASKLLVDRRRLSVRSGHGVGKSAFMAWCVLWFLVCYFPAKVPCTAPTSHQLSDVLWSEIAKWHRALAERDAQLAELFQWSGEALRLRAAPNECFAVARTSRPENPEALQGFHAEHILFLIDEASGVPDKVFEVAEGALSTEGAMVVMASNPTRKQGYFFDSHHRMRAHWAALHVNGEDCPRVARAYIETMRQKYGAQSPIYRVRVLGEFIDAVDGVIPLDLCEAAIDRDVMLLPKSSAVWGLDVARFGDDSTALAKRRGNHQVGIVQERFGIDTMQTVGWVKAEYEAAPPDLRPVSINVDVIGLGAGVVDRLKELGLPVHGVNVAEAAPANVTGDKRFHRLRDELWWRGREWLERRDCRMADDQETIGELTVPTYDMLSTGCIKVESKDELKKRGVKSPNRADAWLLTFADGRADPGKLYPQLNPTPGQRSARAV